MPSVGRPVRGNKIDRLYVSFAFRLGRQYGLFVPAARGAPPVELNEPNPKSAENKLRAGGRPHRGSTEQPTAGSAGVAAPCKIVHPDVDGAGFRVRQRRS